LQQESVVSSALIFNIIVLFIISGRDRVRDAIGADKERQSLSLIVSADCGIFEYVKKQKTKSRTHPRVNGGLRAKIQVYEV
jgi:hypothetical protein